MSTDELAGTTYPAMMPGDDYWVPTCGDCGVLVINEERHKDWHARVGL